MAIKFFFNDVVCNITGRKKLKKFIVEIFKEEGKELVLLGYVFCTDEFLLSLNQGFLQHDDYTDVITFTLSETGEAIMGEIYISTERVKENSIQSKVSFENELCRVMFHGALHLCGYMDKMPSDKLQMTLAENRYLKEYFK